MFKIILPKFNLRVEKWKWNKEYRIYVSTLGNFKDEYKRNLPIQIAQRDGYCMIKTSVGIKKAHRLVMLTWKPIPNAENLTVDHLNHNKRDNSLYNLEWVSREENLRRSDRDVTLEREEPYSITIRIKGKEFKNYKEAIDFCKSKIHPNQRNIVKDKKILANIKKAIKTNGTYLNKHWYLD